MTLTFNPKRAMVITNTHKHKYKFKGQSTQSVQKTEWKQTGGRRDGPITFPANVVVKNCNCLRMCCQGAV